MNQALPQVSFNGSRLVRFLHGLEVSEAQVIPQDHAEKLSQLLDFAGSITLLDAHDEVKHLKFESVAESCVTVKEDFLKVRTSMVQFIIKSFVPTTDHVRNKVPTLKPGVDLQQMTSFEPFERFYLAHQREIDFRVQNLRVTVRDSISGYSRELAQLAVLDTALGETTAAHTRKCFSVVPKLMGKRFKHLLHEHQLLDRQVNEDVLTDSGLDAQKQQNFPGMTPEQSAAVESTVNQSNTSQSKKSKLTTINWLDQFCAEMQGLLLAELEVRLQPVLGMIEAFNEEVEKINE